MNLNRRTIVNNLYEELKIILSKYDNKRAIACEVLDLDGMKEAIIDELEDQGYRICETE